MLKRKRREIARAVDQIQNALGGEEVQDDVTTAPSPSPFPPTSSKKKLMDESKIIRKPGNEISVSSVTRTIPVSDKKTPPGVMRVISGATFTGMNFGGNSENFEQQISEQLKMSHNQQAKVTHVPVNNNNSNSSSSHGDGGGDSLDATIAQLNELVDGGINVPPPPPPAKKKAEPPSTLDEWDKIAGRLCP